MRSLLYLGAVVSFFMAVVGFLGWVSKPGLNVFLLFVLVGVVSGIWLLSCAAAACCKDKDRRGRGAKPSD